MVYRPAPANQPEETLTPKETAVLRRLQSVYEASPREISRAVRITRPSVSDALAVLLRLKKIERVGQGRATKYRKIA